MNGVKDILNILLLSVSLATVLVTLVSYLFFKLRYSLSQKRGDVPNIMEGSFFNRYSPKLQKENIVYLNNADSTKTQRISPQKKVMIVFACCFVFIFFVLTAENFYSSRDRSSTVDAGKGDYRTLIKKGLLKKYSINQDLTTLNPEELNTAYVKSLKTILLRDLRDKRIVLIVDRHNKTHNSSRYGRAFDQWKSFLKRNELPFRISGISQLKEGELAILPQMIFLSLEQRKQLKQHTEKGSLLLTGRAGTFYEKNKVAPANFLKETEGIGFSSNENKQYFPTQFIGSYGLTPGKIIKMYPIDNSYYLKHDDNPLFESYSRTANETAGPIDRLEVRDFTHKDKNLTWLHVDPLEKASFAGDYFFLAKLHQTFKIPFIEVAPWRKAQFSSAFSFTVDTEHGFSKVNYFLDILEEHKVPATFFMVSNLLKKYNDRDLSTVNSIFEFGSHTNDHESMLGLTFRDLFTKLEDSRFDIEERTFRKVAGFRPPKEEIDQTGLAAVAQNKFSYIVESNRFLSFSPVYIHDELLHVPRTMRDDYNYVRDRTMRKNTLITQNMKNDLQWVHESRGYHVLSLHTQLFGQEKYHQAVSDFIATLTDKSIWTDTVGNISTWWKQKSKISVEIKEGKYYIANNSPKAVKNFELLIHNPLKLADRCKIRSLGQSFIFKKSIKIQLIEANSSLDICGLLKK